MNGMRDRGQRIAQRDAGVRQRARIDQDEAVPSFARGVDAIDQRTLGVRLESDQLVAGCLRDRGQIGIDLGQGRTAIGLRLALPSRFRLGPCRTRILAKGRASPKRAALSLY